MLLLRMGSCPKLQVRRISKGILAIQIQIQRNSQEQHPTASTKWKWQVHICLLPLFMYKCISNKNDLIDSTNRHDSSKRPYLTLPPPPPPPPTTFFIALWKTQPAGIPRVCVLTFANWPGIQSLLKMYPTAPWSMQQSLMPFSLPHGLESRCWDGREGWNGMGKDGPRSEGSQQPWSN